MCPCSLVTAPLPAPHSDASTTTVVIAMGNAVGTCDRDSVRRRADRGLIELSTFDQERDLSLITNTLQNTANILKVRFTKKGVGGRGRKENGVRVKK